MRRIVATLAFGLPLLACGGHSDAPSPVDAGVTKVNGSIGGVSFPAAAYAIAVPNNENVSGDPFNEYGQLALAIASKTLGCATPSLPDSIFIGIELIAPGSVPVGPGTYAINADPQSSNDNVAALVTTDASCAETAPANCIGGSVTIVSATATAIAGSFTLAFDSGEALTGTFNADVCAAIPSSVSGKPC
jgi:hypothetical protein